MNFIPKRCPVICHIEKEGAVSFENERDGINLQRKSMINLYMISFLNDGHFSFQSEEHMASGFEK